MWGTTAGESEVMQPIVVDDQQVHYRRLDVFLRHYRDMLRTDNEVIRLARFLDDFGSLAGTVPEWERAAPDKEALQRFLPVFRASYERSWRQGAFIDFWSLAGLGRGELRNTEILAWFLNPSAPHGFGAEFLKAWMRDALAPTFVDLQAAVQASRTYRVETEVNPFSTIDNRLDIEIENDGFYICVEVKIDAPEGSQQLSRYVDICRERAGGRPWAIILLTPNGLRARTSDSAMIVPASWRRLANAIRSAELSPRHERGHLPSLLLDQFLETISNF
uniref:PDDEXK-like family protein n=1 Tax=Ensifer adhaerens TaxID=106592 RepID=UPI003F49322B